WGRGDRPVINVSWEDAQRYVGWLSRVTRQPYRLLSEAEWEYAARAGSRARYAWGDEIGQGNANCFFCGSEWDGKKTTPVGSFKHIGLGLHDMQENVGGGFQEAYHRSYQEAPADGSAWQGGEESSRAHRGGAWGNQPSDLRSPFRGWSTEASRR